MDIESNIQQKIKLKEIQQECKITEKNSGYQIKGITVANNSQFFATFEKNCAVCLFKKGKLFGDKNKEIEWIFAGKQRSHSLEITDIAFGERLDENQEPKLMLFSIGEDRMLYEYNIYKSNEKGLIIENGFKIE